MKKDCRKDFPLLNYHPDLVYLDSAATTHKPQCVIEAMDHFYREQYGTVHRSVYSLAKEATHAYYGVRVKLKSFLNAKSEEEIVFTRGTTASLNLIARSYGSLLKPGDRILISQTEHHSNIVPWQMLCAEKGLFLDVIPVNENGEIGLEELEKKLSSQVKILSIAHISNALGVVHPIKEIISLAHRFGTKVCIDGAQSVSHLPIDVQALDADFFVFSGHKMYGPTGIGVLYGKKELLSIMPPIEGGGDMIDQVTFESTSYQPPPLRFEAGTPMIAEVIGLGSALDYLQSLDLASIHAWEMSLLEDAYKKLESLERIRLLGRSQAKGAILSFVVEGAHPLDVATLLDCKQIALRSGHMCSQPTMEVLGLSSLLRLSLGVYNSLEDVERFVEAMKSILKTI